MTKIFTLRLDAVLLNETEARAARLGLNRAAYVRSLIQVDLSKTEETKAGSFSSEDLAGMYEGNGRVASNPEVRSRLRARSEGTP